MDCCRDCRTPAAKKNQGDDERERRRLIAVAAFYGWAASTEPGQSKNRGELWFGPRPDLGKFAHVYVWFVSASKLGESLSWSELKSWSDMTGTVPSPDDCELMIAMSNVWAKEYRGGCQKCAVFPAIVEEFVEWI